MLVVLPVLSFICAGLLAVFLIILIRRPTVNTSNVSIVLWLLFGNAVHAVNTIVWFSTTSPGFPSVKIADFLDTVTKLLLGVTIALPGVCLCSARYLELLSSDRKIYPNTYSKRFHTLLDVALCYVLPLLYMILHFAVQDHRFDLVENFGCSAAINRSTPAVLIMIIPPLILCSISLVLCKRTLPNNHCLPLLTVWNYARLSSERFTSHLSARSNSVSVPLFTRRLVKSILLTASVLIVTLFPLLGPRHRSWAQFRPNYSAILFVREPAEVGAVQTVWWSIPVVSMVYLVLTLVLGDETTDTFSWVQRRFPTVLPRGRPARPELSRLTFQHEMVSKYCSLVTPSLAAPQPVQLRSGWDDMLDVKVKGRRAFLNPNPSRKSVVSSATDSDDDSPSSSPTLKDDLEDAFTSSTLSYLASPVAQALGLPSPIASSTFASLVQSRSQGTSPTVASPMGSSAMPSPSPIAPSPAPVLRVLIPMTPPIPEDTASTISSIWDAPWPLPPATPTPTLLSPARSPTRSPTVSRSPTRSPTLSSRTTTRTAASRAPVPRKPVVPVRSALARGYAATDVIYMTRTGEATVILR
ncbi:pheromone A receptor-domain-containing protein [Mycena alexandri]|uniref:Pheromone A receptor-domain-containing protein n=1 Tax=Mycena alexandri TaxID=1745969 RepID=A0AAD6SHJ6_9AGAR|nr:pheromone A receptor-domain-containing protein [Mycena alexandri]